MTWGQPGAPLDNSVAGNEVKKAVKAILKAFPIRRQPPQSETPRGQDDDTLKLSD